MICGSCIYTYEHFDPEFADAKSHDPLGITLLCGSHQIEKTKGLLSKAIIAKADQNPKCLQDGYSNYMFDIGQTAPDIYLGSNKLSNVRHVFNFCGHTCFSVLPPENDSKFWRLTAEFSDGKDIMCKIVENELRVFNEAYNFEQTANRFVVTDEKNDQIFSMTLVDSKDLHIERCIVVHNEARLAVAGDTMTVDIPGGMHMRFVDCNFTNCLAMVARG